MLEQWRHVGSRAAANEGNKTGGSGTSSSSLSSYTDGESHRHLQSQENNTNSRFVFCFRSASPPSSFFSNLQ